MREIFRTILLNREAEKKMLAVLIDPEKCQGPLLAATIAALKVEAPDFIFVGGSLTSTSTKSLIELFKEETESKIILFPGNASQFTPNADALLFMSLISGRNPDYLIGQQVQSAISVKNSGMEVIPMGYILIEGDAKSSVEYISNTQPIPREKKGIVLSTALAGELLGMHIIYLEAGSGAKSPVSPELIQYVSENISIPLIVGGGITTPADMISSFEAGADIVVIGNFFEKYPYKIPDFIEYRDKYYEEKRKKEEE
ncbi:geranylgeranylglyceryl/heptaprenylglyceryl phosphate synthase [Paludibacter sp. 221]|uniref:geranylgeranylglyceryl/heptaprenylglyceryl phosphate synthase n=1 Tax=Paludibacter sp. 221 TaxID=2302939 RepID=UPI0013D42016|nr:geranylgeranylglyceryl/heptaprenylglyceryl phosphate synthase [Paludibacter sp. 221]NDV46857.1 geranylgeranylglyceryl/heptaprenylglyceryl phosphate synthase [Paludibacter sp. 221]